MTVVGLDLSLTSTGVAILGDKLHCSTVKTNSSQPMGERLDWIKHKVWDAYRIACSLVVLEDLPTHAHGAGQTAMVHGVVRWELWRDDVPHITVPPATLKVFATGKGNATKDAMIAEACRRLDYQGTSNDEADALWLAHLGAHLLGRPAVDLPQTHLRALTKIKAAA